jgi:hypothetical protein
MLKQSLQDITSKQFLDRALEGAKYWCKDNLVIYLQCFSGDFNYNIFNYKINNDKRRMLGIDMSLDNESPGLIFVSTDKIKWLQKRERYFRELNPDEPEVDPESMFVHEITEFIAERDINVLVHYLSKFQPPHNLAREIENINRVHRGLKPWICPF